MDQFIDKSSSNLSDFELYKQIIVLKLEDDIDSESDNTDNFKKYLYNDMIIKAIDEIDELDYIDEYAMYSIVYQLVNRCKKGECIRNWWNYYISKDENSQVYNGLEIAQKHKVHIVSRGRNKNES